MTLLPQVRNQLHEAAARRARRRLPRVAALADWRRRRGWHRTPLIAIAVGLGLAGVALASGVIRFGAPALGGQTDEILTELGYTPEQIAALTGFGT